MPPAIAPNTICRLMPMPEMLSGLMYSWYCAYRIPPTQVISAETMVTPSLRRVMLMPIEAAASSSWLIASSARRDIERSTRVQTHSPSSHTTRIT